MSEHTSGPWQVNGTAIEYENSDGFSDVVAYVESEENTDWIANARLMAAAPELLAALEEIDRLITKQSAPDATSTYITLNQVRDLARLAIVNAGALLIVWEANGE